MAIKLIAFDLDGTLLTDDKSIDELTRQKIIEVQKQGIIVVIATGRDKGAINFVYEPLELEHHGNNYIAGLNGQIIYSFQKKEYSVDRVFSYHDAYKINALGKRMNMEVVSCCGHDYYDFVSFSFNLVKKIGSFLFGQPMDFGFKQGERRFLRLPSADTKIDKDINKFVLIHTPWFFRRHLANIRQELCDYDVVKVGEAWIEIMPKGVNKGQALLNIAAKNNISPDEMMAFGDAENDLEMLKIVKYGIAMGNAMKEVKDVAFEVSDDNNHCGIAKMLDKYVLNKQ